LGQARSWFDSNVANTPKNELLALVHDKPVASKQLLLPCFRRRE
jgi:hypothetical protein